MPLTFAHPVAVLPLRRCGLPLSALVVGSVAPDLEYLLHLAPRGDVGHTMAGLPLFCLPAGLLVLWVFHRIWKRPLQALVAGAAPASREPGPFAFWPLGRFALLIAAVLIGALTHLAWDSFTHPHGWMVQQVPALAAPILETHWGAVPLYKGLQHGSTAFGLSVLAVMAWRQRAAMRHVSRAGWGVLALLCVTSAGIGGGIAWLRAAPLSDLHAVQRMMGIWVVAFSAAVVALVTLLSLAWYVRAGDAAETDDDRRGERNGLA